MNEEEKEAIEYLKVRLYGNEGCKYIDVTQEDLRIFLKLVTRKEKELENWKKYCDEQEENITEKSNKICDLEFEIENQQLELEKKDKRISDLEYVLIDMVMQFADRHKIKDYHYALSTMGLSALETAFAELDFDDPMPVAEAEKKYKVLVDKYYERKVENGN